MLVREIIEETNCREDENQSMEDSFRVRVDKVFGSLGSYTASSPGVNPSLWSLTDEEVQKREWNRSKLEEEDDEAEEGDDDGELQLEPSGVKKMLESDLQELSDEDEAEGIGGDTRKRRREMGTCAETRVDDYLDVQSNIGRDYTLDYEEEEDEYDKVAVGEKRKGDRVYMKDVKSADYGIDDANEYGELPTTFRAVVKDPRANHEAAKIRLKEDADAAGNFDTLQLSDKSNATKDVMEDSKKEQSEGDNPKPILKKKENAMDSRSQKRVRFNVEAEVSIQAHEDHQTSEALELTSESQSTDENIAEPEQASELFVYSSRVPDYLRNPSKYTRYTFDSSDDMDDQSNRAAYMEFFSSLRKQKDTDKMEDETSSEIPKSIVFTPKRKPHDDPMAKRSEIEHNAGNNMQNKGFGVTAVEDPQESDVSAMEEGEPVDKEHSIQKSGRQYRARTSVGVDDDLN